MAITFTLPTIKQPFQAFSPKFGKKLNAPQDVYFGNQRSEREEALAQLETLIRSIRDDSPAMRAYTAETTEPAAKLIERGLYALDVLVRNNENADVPVLLSHFEAAHPDQQTRAVALARTLWGLHAKDQVLQALGRPTT